MPNLNIILGAIILIQLIIIIWLAVKGTNDNSNTTFMYGYWVADTAFVESSGISSMLLFIGDETKHSDSKNNNSRNAYLVINNDITNQHIILDYSVTPVDNTRFKCLTNIIFSEPTDQIPDSDVWFDFNIHKGTLRIYKDDVLYASMYKDNDVTNTLSAQPKPVDSE